MCIKILHGAVQFCPHTGWECVQRHHHEQWQMVEEMEGWASGGTAQGQADDSFFSPNNHHVSESEMEDLDLAK